MVRGKANPAWLIVAVVMGVACIGGGSLVITSFANNLKKTVDDRRQEQSTNHEIEGNLRDLLQKGELGKRPTFADTPIGKQQSLAYGLLELQLARQKTFLKELDASGFAWVMTPESLKSEKNLDESLARLAKARELAQWYYEGITADFEKTLANMKQAAGSDATAKRYIGEFEAGARKPDASIELNRKVAVTLRKNHDALEGCLKTLKSQSGKYKVSSDGSITFDAAVPDAVINTYNGYVQATTATMNEINRLESKRADMVNTSLGQFRGK